MLAKRVIPTLLVKGRQLFKGVGFRASERSIGHAAQAVRVHGRRAVDELCLLDITATAEGRGPDLDLVTELSEELFIPLTVGGGVRSLHDIDALLRAGADKVAICTGAYEVPGLIEQAAERFGRQAVVGCVDAAEWLVYFRGGVMTHFSDPVICASDLERMGAGEILLQSIPRDGTLTGYDLDLIREVSAAVSIPVIASGGCGTYQHMLEAIQAGADAVAAGAMFQFTDATPKGAARFLKEHGICVRL